MNVNEHTKKEKKKKWFFVNSVMDFFAAQFQQ